MKVRICYKLSPGMKPIVGSTGIQLSNGHIVAEVEEAEEYREQHLSKKVDWHPISEEENAEYEKILNPGTDNIYELPQCPNCKYYNMFKEQK